MAGGEWLSRPRVWTSLPLFVMPQADNVGTQTLLCLSAPNMVVLINTLQQSYCN